MASMESASRVEVSEVLIGHRTYLSTQHLWMAEYCARYASEYEQRHVANKPAFHIHLRGNVLATITESVAFLEALVNELLEDAHGNHSGHIDVLDIELRRKLGEYWRISNGNDSILAKYEMVRTLAGLEAYDRGANPYQDASLLVRLRNWQVHYRPTTVWGNETHSMEKQLKGRFAESLLMTDAGNPWFPDKALGGPCAEWCVATARSFADEFVAAMNYQPNYTQVDHPDIEPYISGQ